MRYFSCDFQSGRVIDNLYNNRIVVVMMSCLSVEQVTQKVDGHVCRKQPFQGLQKIHGVKKGWDSLAFFNSESTMTSEVASDSVIITCYCLCVAVYNAGATFLSCSSGSRSWRSSSHLLHASRIFVHVSHSAKPRQSLAVTGSPSFLAWHARQVRETLCVGFIDSFS